MPVELWLVCEAGAVVGAGVMVHRGCSAPCHGEHWRTVLPLPSQTLRSFPVLPISELMELHKGWWAGHLPLLSLRPHVLALLPSVFPQLKLNSA